MARLRNFKVGAMYEMAHLLSKGELIGVKWRPVTSARLREIVEWIDTDEAAGDAYLHEDEVLFTDSNTALDFKMRFG